MKNIAFVLCQHRPGGPLYFAKVRRDGTIKITPDLRNAQFFSTIPEALNTKTYVAQDHAIMAVELKPLIPSVLENHSHS